MIPVDSAIHLVSIKPDARLIDAKWFGDDKDAAWAWAQAQNIHLRNVYWTVNVCREGLDKKPSKADIVSVRFGHVDIDPPFDTGKVLAGLASADIIVHSGNGIQAFWAADPSVTKDEIEEFNMRVAQKFNADHCHNVDRLMRVPGLKNYPDAKKRAMGRPITEALLIKGPTQ